MLPINRCLGKKEIFVFAIRNRIPRSKYSSEKIFPLYFDNLFLYSFPGTTFFIFRGLSGNDFRLILSDGNFFFTEFDIIENVPIFKGRISKLKYNKKKKRKNSLYFFREDDETVELRRRSRKKVKISENHVIKDVKQRVGICTGTYILNISRVEL